MLDLHPSLKIHKVFTLSMLIQHEVMHWEPAKTFKPRCVFILQTRESSYLHCSGLLKCCTGVCNTAQEGGIVTEVFPQKESKSQQTLFDVYRSSLENLLATTITSQRAQSCA